MTHDRESGARGRERFRGRGRFGGGFSMIELLVVVIILALLLAIVLPLLARGRDGQREVQCLSNLRQVAQAFHVYAAANDDCLPDELNPQPWDVLLEAYAGGVRNAFVCPAEAEMGQAMPLSYGWRESMAVWTPEASLSGRRLGSIKDTSLAMVFETVPGNHREDRINAATVDAVSAIWPAAELDENLAKPAQ